jgi:TRAP-type C4-dicarboxylate transport system permease small subunit
MEGERMKTKHLKPIEHFCSVLIVIMTLIIVYRVIMRFFFNNTPSWSEELTALLMVYITLLSFPLGIKDDQHLSLTMFYEKLPKSLQYIVTLLNYILILAFSGFVLVYNGILMVQMTSSSYLSSLPVRNAVLYIMVPIAGVLAVVFTTIKMIQEITLHRKGNQHESN